MSVAHFIDTNVFVYALYASPSEQLKSVRAKKLIADVSFGISVQVLQEFYVTVTRKIAVPISASEALAFAHALAKRPCVHMDRDLFTTAAAIAESFTLSYWDGAMLAAAHRLGAQTLYSEDLGHRQNYGSLTVINPFAD